jgi:hypothetical protein
MIKNNLRIIKNVMSYCLILFTGISNLYGQSFNQKYGTESDYKRLYYLNNQYINSWIHSDTTTYNQLLWAEDFVHQSGSTGLLFPKLQIGKIFGQQRFHDIVYFYADEVQIRFITNDAALVFAKPPYLGINDKEESLSRYNDVYVRRNGAWVCVSANITNIQKEGEKSVKFSKPPEFVPLISLFKGTEKDIQTLESLNKKHAEAFLKFKPALLKDILADDFILLSSNGQLYEKEKALKQLNDANNRIESYKIENKQIRFVANDVAMIHAAIIANNKDGSTTGVQYNDVYVKRGEAWVCVSGNNTLIKN